jgi:hypothetical protein
MGQSRMLVCPGTMDHPNHTTTSAAAAEAAHVKKLQAIDSSKAIGGPAQQTMAKGAVSKHTLVLPMLPMCEWSTTLGLCVLSRAACQ